MNADLAKIETNHGVESGQFVPDGSDIKSAHSLPSSDEALLEENTDRKIYRRSAAYFLFGLGSNQHSIITDEP